MAYENVVSILNESKGALINQRNRVVNDIRALKQKYDEAKAQYEALVAERNSLTADIQDIETVIGQLEGLS